MAAGRCLKGGGGMRMSRRWGESEGCSTCHMSVRCEVITRVRFFIPAIFCALAQGPQVEGFAIEVPCRRHLCLSSLFHGTPASAESLLRLRNTTRGYLVKQHEEQKTGSAHISGGYVCGNARFSTGLYNSTRTSPRAAKAYMRCMRSQGCHDANNCLTTYMYLRTTDCTTMR